MILIVGCGFLGSHLLNCISSKTNEPTIATVRNLNDIPPINGITYVKCDVTDTSDLINLAGMCKAEPLTVFYFAACHNIDYVYEKPDTARQVNIEALKNFITIIPNIKKLFFSSTDCVYGEGKDSSKKFDELSSLSPVNEYGRQKIDAEKIVISNGYTVLRLPFMLGPSDISKAHFYDNIRKKLLNGEAIEMINGMKRSVLSYRQTAELIYLLSLLPTDRLPKIINVCSDTELSKYEMGCVIAKNLNAPPYLIKSISEEQGEKFFKDKRASRTAMDNSLLKTLLGLEEILWDEETK